MASTLLGKLKVGRLDGKKGSKFPLTWSEEEKLAFETPKKAMLKQMSLQVVNPAWSFVLRTDASGCAIGVVLEQAPRVEGMPTLADTASWKIVPVAFMSRKLTTSQARTWNIKDKEAYAVVSAFEKWASWIGQQPVLILTDHKTLQSWTHEILQDPMGPSGRGGMRR